MVTLCSTRAGFIELSALMGMLLGIGIMSLMWVASVMYLRQVVHVTERSAQLAATLQLVTAVATIADPRISCRADGACLIDGSGAMASGLELIGYLPEHVQARQGPHRVDFDTPWGTFVVADLSRKPT